MRKSVKYGLIGAVVFLVVAGGIATLAWRIAGLSIVESAITESLREQGVPVSALTLRSIGTGAAVLTDIRIELAGGLTIRRIEAHYRLVELVRDRRVDRVDLSGVRVALPSPGSARDEPAEPGPAMPVLPALPVGSIVMRDSAMTVATPIGEFGVAVDLDARPSADGGIDLSGQAIIRGETGQATVPFTAVVSEAGDFDLALTLEAGRLGWRGALLDLREGRVLLAGTLAGLRTMDGRLAADLTMPDGTAASLTAAAELKDDSARLEIGLDSGGVGRRAGLTAAVSGLDRGSPAFELAMDADMLLLRSVSDLAGAALGTYSQGALKARYSGNLENAADGADPRLSGRLAAEADLVSVESGLRFTTDLEADLTFGAGAARLKSTMPAHLSWRQGAEEDAITLTVGDDTGGAFEAVLGQAGSGWTVKATGPFGLTDRHGMLSGALDLTASADTAEHGLAGRFAANVDASGSVLGVVKIEGGRAELAAAFDLDGGRWRVRPDACMPVTAKHLAIVGRLTVPDGLSTCLAGRADRPMFEVGPAAADGVTLDLAIQPDPATMMLEVGAAEPLRLDIDIPETTISARLAGEAGPSTEFAASDATVNFPGLALAVDDIAFGLSTGAAPLARLRLESAYARSLENPAWFAPLRITGEATMESPFDIGFAGGVRGADGAITATVEGRHNLASGAGRVGIRLDPVSFAPGVRRLVDLAPALGPASVRDVSGSVAATARIDWGERLSSAGELRLEDLTLTVFEATVRGIDATLRADSLIPLSLPDGQVVTLDGADIGFALDEGAISFGLAEGDRLSVQGVGFELADGVLAVEPFRTELGARTLSLVVMMQGVDLARLSRQFPVEGLTLTGRIDGRVPIRLIEDTISIDNGIVESTEAGVIRYVPALPLGPAGEGGVALLMSAVQNFQYDGLRATLNGETGDELEVAIRLTGANPELYDGFPIALNINLSGALDQILQSGLRAMGIAGEAGSLLRRE